MRAPLCSADPKEILGTEAIEDPYSFYARLRREAPIARVGDTGVHLVSTWALVDEALQREADFSANLTGLLIRGEDGLPMAFPIPGTGANQVIATADEPHHTTHRQLVQPGLTDRRAAALEATLREWAVDALRPWLAEGGGDCVPIAELIPARVVAQVLGLPDGDVTRFRKWAMMGGDMLAGDVAQQTMVELAQETGRMVDYLGGHLDAAEPLPHGEADAPMLRTLAGGVARAEVSREEALGIAIVMFGAGGESTAGLIGSALRWLAEDEALAEQLRADPSLVPRFLEEVARLEPPFKFHYRAVQRRCELGGADLEAGDRLMLMWASANRDAEHFEEPDHMRLDRRHPKQHMSFGRGPHFCIGAPLARLEARVVVEELLARTQRVSLRAGERPRYTPSIFIRRLERLVLDAVC